jgi:hypothetical protein
MTDQNDVALFTAGSGRAGLGKLTAALGVICRNEGDE